MKAAVRTPCGRIPSSPARSLMTFTWTQIVPSFELIYRLIMGGAERRTSRPCLYSAARLARPSAPETLIDGLWVFPCFSQAFSIPVCLTTAISSQGSIFIFLILLLLFKRATWAVILALVPPHPPTRCGGAGGGINVTWRARK